MIGLLPFGTPETTGGKTNKKKQLRKMKRKSRKINWR